MDVVDRDVHVEFGDAALIVVDPDADRVAGILLVIEQQPVLDGDEAGARIDVEAAAGVVDQGVGEGRAVRIGRDHGADRRAVRRILVRGERPGDAGRRRVAGDHRLAEHDRAGAVAGGAAGDRGVDDRCPRSSAPPEASTRWTVRVGALPKKPAAGLKRIDVRGGEQHRRAVRGRADIHPGSRR